MCIPRFLFLLRLYIVRTKRIWFFFGGRTVPSQSIKTKRSRLVGKDEQSSRALTPESPTVPRSTSPFVFQNRKGRASNVKKICLFVASCNTLAGSTPQCSQYISQLTNKLSIRAVHCSETSSAFMRYIILIPLVD